MTIRGPEQIPPPTLRLPTMGLSGWKNNLMACHLRYSHVPTETVRGSPRDYSDHPRTAGARSPPPQHRSLHSRDGSPPEINHVDFSDTMDRTQRHLKVPRISNYYQDPVFATKFATTGSSSWAYDVFTYPEEKHNSFLLRLGGQLPFTFAGNPSEQQRPMVFSIPASPMVQPVPTNFIELILCPPTAVWRESVTMLV